MASFYYNDQNLSDVFPFTFKFSNPSEVSIIKPLNCTRKQNPEGFGSQVVVVKWRHRANGLLSMTLKRSIGWYRQSSTGPEVFSHESHARLYPFDKPIKTLYFRLFVVSVLFARFHFKVIRKSLYNFTAVFWIVCCWVSTTQRQKYIYIECFNMTKT